MSIVSRLRGCQRIVVVFFALLVRFFCFFVGILGVFNEILRPEGPKRPRAVGVPLFNVLKGVLRDFLSFLGIFISLVVSHYRKSLSRGQILTQILT